MEYTFVVCTARLASSYFGNWQYSASCCHDPGSSAGGTDEADPHSRNHSGACPHTIGLDGRGRPSSTESVPTQSRLHTIPVPLRIFADQPPKLAVSVVEGAVQPRSAAFREGHGFSHAESYACSPDPTAHVGATPSSAQPGNVASRSCRSFERARFSRVNT